MYNFVTSRGPSHPPLAAWRWGDIGARVQLLCRQAIDQPATTPARGPNRLQLEAAVRVWRLRCMGRRHTLHLGCVRTCTCSRVGVKQCPHIWVFGKIAYLLYPRPTMTTRLVQSKQPTYLPPPCLPPMSGHCTPSYQVEHVRTQPRQLRCVVAGLGPSRAHCTPGLAGKQPPRGLQLRRGRAPTTTQRQSVPPMDPGRAHLLEHGYAICRQVVPPALLQPLRRAHEALVTEHNR